MLLTQTLRGWNRATSATIRSILLQVFCKKGVLKNLTNLTGKRSLRVSFLIKSQVWDLQLYLTKTPIRCFPVSSAGFLETLFSQNTYGGLLLYNQNDFLWNPANVFDLFEKTARVFNGALSCLRQFLATESPLKNDEKCFLLYFKSSFRFQDI